MAGGWGASVQAPMEIPREKPHRYLGRDLPVTSNPRQTELPVIRDSSVGTARLATKALPSMPGGKITQSGRMEEAAEYAFAMGQAFGITKSYNQRSAAIAKAKNKAQTRLTKHRARDAVKGGRGRSNFSKSREKGAGFRSAQTFGYHPYGSMY